MSIAVTTPTPADIITNLAPQVVEAALRVAEARVRNDEATFALTDAQALYQRLAGDLVSALQEHSALCPLVHPPPPPSPPRLDFAPDRIGGSQFDATKTY